MSQELSYLISYAFKYLHPEMQYFKDLNKRTIYTEIVFLFTVLSVNTFTRNNALRRKIKMF